MTQTIRRDWVTNTFAFKHYHIYPNRGSPREILHTEGEEAVWLCRQRQGCSLSQGVRQPPEAGRGKNRFFPKASQSLFCWQLVFGPVTLILDFWAPEQWENISYHFKNQVCGNLLQQPQEANFLSSLILHIIPRIFSQPEDWTCISCISCIGRRIFYHQWHTGTPGTYLDIEILCGHLKWGCKQMYCHRNKLKYTDILKRL